jgi:hypothetical protein
MKEAAAMPVFSSREQAVPLFRELFEILLSDPAFTTALRSEGLSARFVHRKPDFQLDLDADGVRVDQPAGTPSLVITMSCDTADALWSGRLLMPIAVATGRVRIRGSVSKVIEFVPLLHPAFDRYPQLAAAAGIAA